MIIRDLTMPAKKTGSQYQELKQSVRNLFEEAGQVVKKVPQPSDKPSRRSGKKQTDMRPEAPFQAMLSQRAQEILKREKERTGEELTAILERSILNLDSRSESRSEPVGVKETEPSFSAGLDGDDYRSRISERVMAMKEKGNVSFDEIARCFNGEGVRTFSGKGRWHGITISAIYNRLKNK